MRVITGTAKRTQLVSLDPKTHPLSDRAKSGIFSVLGDSIHNVTILDLYAGSGALGIEALSRGARHATFVDIGQKSIESIYKNIAKTHFEDKSEILKMKAEEYVERYKEEKFSLIFACPPYPEIKFHVIQKAVHLLGSQGVLLFEHSIHDSFPFLEEVTKIDERTYGIVHFEMYQKL